MTMVSDRHSDVNSEQGEQLGTSFPTILDSVAILKNVFAHARGPSIEKLRQKVTQIEAYILSTMTLAKQLEIDGAIEASKSEFDLFNNIARQIQRTKGQTDLLQVTVSSLRETLNVDRVSIYRLESGNNLRAVSESAGENWASLLNQTLPLSLFEPESEDNVTGLVPEAVEFTPRQEEFWQRFQVKAGMQLFLTIDRQIWGSIVVHQCCQERKWQQSDRVFLQQVGLLLSVALREEKASISTPSVATTSKEVSSWRMEQRVREGIKTSSRAIEQLNMIRNTLALTRQKLEYLVASSHKGEHLRELIDSLSIQVQFISVGETGTPDAIAHQMEAFVLMVDSIATDMHEWTEELLNSTNAVIAALDPAAEQTNAGLELIIKIQEQLS